MHTHSIIAGSLIIHLLFHLFQSIVGTFSSIKSHDNSFLGNRISVIITPASHFPGGKKSSHVSVENAELNQGKLFTLLKPCLQPRLADVHCKPQRGTSNKHYFQNFFE